MSQDISWGWLEESEAKLNLKAENHLAAEDQRAIGLKLIACIKEMRESLGFYAGENHFINDYKYDEGFSVVADEYEVLAVEDGLKAKETLNRCARGEFEK